MSAHAKDQIEDLCALVGREGIEYWRTPKLELAAKRAIVKFLVNSGVLNKL